MKKPWFGRKNGRGLWLPCSWQGWLSVLLALGLAAVDFTRLDARSHSGSDTLRPWLLDMIVLGAAFFLVAWLTGARAGSSSSGRTEP